MMAVKIVPIMVAFGTVISGSLTFPAGIDADSRPKNAKSVYTDTAGSVKKLLSEVRLKAGKFSILKKNTPKIIINNKGTTLRTVVTT